MKCDLYDIKTLELIEDYLLKLYKKIKNKKEKEKIGNLIERLRAFQVTSF